MKPRYLYKAISLALAVPSSAFAGLLGDSMTLEYRYGAITNVYLAPQSFVAGAQVEFPAYLSNPTFAVDVSDNTITFSNWSFSGSFSGPLHGDTFDGVPVSFNGPVFTDTTHTFLSVSVNPATTIPGVKVSFDTHTIYVNWMDQAYTPASIVVLDVGVATQFVGAQVWFRNTSDTLISTNYFYGLPPAGLTQPYPGTGPPQFIYALFVAPPTVTNIDLLDTNWVFTGAYATNLNAIPGRLNGGYVTVPYPSGATANFMVRGWSSDLAGMDWRAAAVKIDFWATNGGFGSGMQGASGIATIELADGINQLFGTTPGTSLQGFALTVPPLDPGYPHVVSYPHNQTVAAGGNVTVSFWFDGFTPFAFRWRLNGTNLSDGGRISGCTSNALSISAAQPSDSGNYTVVAANSAGSVTSQVVTLTIPGIPRFDTTNVGRAPGQLSVNISGLGGYTQSIIEASTNLRQWAPMATNTLAPGQTNLTFVQSTSNPPTRFFRVNVR
jgi:hypothetical protein